MTEIKGLEKATGELATECGKTKETLTKIYNENLQLRKDNVALEQQFRYQVDKTAEGFNERDASIRGLNAELNRANAIIRDAKILPHTGEVIREDFFAWKARRQSFRVELHRPIEDTVAKELSFDCRCCEGGLRPNMNIELISKDVIRFGIRQGTNPPTLIILNIYDCIKMLRAFYHRFPTVTYPQQI